MRHPTGRLLAIPGWRGYLVSETGRVFSKWRRCQGGAWVDPNHMTELRPFDRKDRHGKPTGYRSVTLSNDGNRSVKYVHAIVMLAFVGPYPSPDHEILHGNNVRSDNRLGNLRYGTVVENLEDREAAGNVLRGARHGRARLTEEIVRQIKRRIALGERDTSIASALGINAGSVHHIRNGKQWSHVAA